MIKVMDETKADLLALHISGEISSQEIDKMNPVLEKMLRDYENPSVYVEIYDFEIPSAKAIWKDLKNIPKYNKLEKCAVVAEKQWLEVTTKISASVMRPRIKFFNYDQKADAMQWLSTT